MQRPVEDQWEIIGKNIKTHRTRQRLSLRALGAKCDASASFLSQLERGTSGAHMATLMKIASSLHISISELMSDVHAEDVHFTSAQNRPLIDDDEHHRKSLITKKGYGSFEIFVHSIAPGRSTADAPYTHGNAQECVVILSGLVEVKIRSQVIKMGVGDSVEYRSSMPHLATNIGTTIAEVMFVVGPDDPS
ncbi:helix-turn-helix domain-containing protein [Shinella granuli]|uniref:helix-turn-helix domain-containing protein n=1 Tax=Shinella granuli TaxID=323621 RepID=UPI0013C37B86